MSLIGDSPAVLSASAGDKILPISKDWTGFSISVGTGISIQALSDSSVTMRGTVKSWTDRQIVMTVSSFSSSGKGVYSGWRWEIDVGSSSTLGPTGPTGPTGADGEDSTVPGPTGPAGPAGASAVDEVLNWMNL